MHKRRNSYFYAKAVGDILLVAVSFLLAVWLAKRHIGVQAAWLGLRANELLFMLFLCLAWAFTARIVGLYDEFRNKMMGFEMWAVLKNILLQVLIALSILFVAKTRTLSRFFVVAYSCALLATLLPWKLVLRSLSPWILARGRKLNQILIVGAGEAGLKFHDTVQANSQLGFFVKGFVAEQPPAGRAVEYLGTLDQLEAVIERERIDDVVIALPNSDFAGIGRVISVCERALVPVRIIPDYFEFMSPRFEISRFGSLPLISIRSIPLESAHWRLLKRGFDLAVSLLAFLLVFSWLWPLLAVLIKATSPGPVFFRQERWGKKNRSFRCYKFRSMVRESTDVGEDGRYQQARRGDPRVTRIGRFLRRSNFDELPQFINVLKGDMSLVGPRPHPAPMNLEVKDSIRRYHLRHLIRPGITGWAQVNGLRGETSDPEMLRRRVEADIWYIENWSFALDLKILFLSAWAMLRGDPNAY